MSVVIGKLGSGKSTLINVLNGFKPSLCKNNKSKLEEVMWAESDLTHTNFSETSNKKQHCTHGLKVLDPHLSLADNESNLKTLFVDTEGLEDLNNPKLLLNLEYLIKHTKYFGKFIFTFD